MMCDTFDAARFYASEYDWPIFLCQARSKRPLVESSWKDEATTDPRRIERLLRKHPDANIASPAGFSWDVLDVDDSQAARTLRDYGVLPITVTQRTPGGPDRTHHFLKHQE